MSSCFCFVFLALATVATVVLESLVHGGGAHTNKTIQAQASRQQADIQTHESTNTQTASRHTNTWKHMGGANTSKHAIQAQASKQQTHESTNKQTASRHTRHKKTTPDTWMHRDKTDTQDTRHKHKHNHESHMKAQTNRQQADIQDTRRTTTDTRMHRGIQDTRRQDRHKKTTTDTRMHRGNNRQHKHCNKIAYIDVHACKQTYMFISCP